MTFYSPDKWPVQNRCVAGNYCRHYCRTKRSAARRAAKSPSM